MKKSKKIEDNIRDFFHVFIGFTFLYIIGSYTDFSTYTLESKIIGCTSVSFVIGGILGFLWELYQLKKEKILFIGKRDILLTATGGLAGGLASLWFPDIFLLGLTLFVISALLVLRDLKNYK